MKRRGQEVAVLVVDHAFEERGADAVGEAAAHLALRDERIEEAARVVHGDVLENADRPVSRSTSTTATSTTKPCAAEEATRSSSSGGSRFGAA